MHTYQLLSASRTIRNAGVGVLGWIVAGAVAAGLFGLLYGTLYGLLHANLSGVVSTAGYFALCGAAAATILAAFVRVLDLSRSGEIEERTAAALLADRTAVPRPARFPPFHPTRRGALPTSTSGNVTRVGDPSLN